MKLKNLTVLLAICVLSATVQTARADLGYWSAALVGFWNHPTNGDVYHFYSDATYTFYKFQKTGNREGLVSHSGWWKIYDPGNKVSGSHGPVGLRLKARRQVVLRDGKRHTLKTRRVDELLVNTSFGVEGDPSENGQYYLMDGVKWARTG